MQNVFLMHTDDELYTSSNDEDTMVRKRFKNNWEKKETPKVEDRRNKGSKKPRKREKSEVIRNDR